MNRSVYCEIKLKYTSLSATFGSKYARLEIEQRYGRQAQLFFDRYVEKRLHAMSRVEFRADYHEMLSYFEAIEALSGERFAWQELKEKYPAEYEQFKVLYLNFLKKKRFVEMNLTYVELALEAVQKNAQLAAGDEVDGWEPVNPELFAINSTYKRYGREADWFFRFAKDATITLWRNNHNV